MNYYLYGAIAAAPILGYILSDQKNVKPKGLLKIQSLSDITSENPTWHLPLVLIGMFLSFSFNVGAYTLYFITFILGYLGYILNWVYEKIILPVVKVLYRIAVMIVDLLMSILRLFIRYFISMPIDILLAVINVVPSVVNWKSYKRSLKVILAGFLAYALLEFIAHLTGQGLIGTIGGPFCLAIAVTWVVGLVSFNGHDKGKRAALFAISVIGLILGITVLILGTNQLDDTHGWGGTFAGLWYAPSVIGVVAALVLVLTVVFITNVGAIYINTIGEEGDFKSRIKGVANESFKRSWYFLWQPIFVLVIGGILSIIPYYVVNFSAEQLEERVVDQIMVDNDSQLNEELKDNTISNRTDWILNDTLTDKEFKACLDTLTTESDLKLRISENAVYQGYYSKTIPLRSIPGKVSSKEAIDNMVKSAKDKIKNLKESKKDQAESFDEQLKSMREYEADQEDIAKVEQRKKRNAELLDNQIASASAELSFRESCGTKYSMTYLFFLLGKAVLFSLVLTLLVNTYAYSVRPVYDMHQSSYLVNEVKTLNAKDRMQPWIGILLISLLAGGYFMGGPYLNSIWSKVSGMWTSTEQVDAGASTDESTDVSTEAEIDGTVEMGDDGMSDDAMEGMSDPFDGSEEGDVFICNDGEVIPRSYLYDGECDCNECEDEDRGD